ncbi:hypothetical protein F1737_07060 [Methanoplanus sp. FWC-SCC4]|uniref:Bulb-type lectin domain-containing protein n=1 Tax=Methanochimaera problematica TaxID=2609417 RepID=A0AA97FFH1_9EURY|nr:hypothetical protein [Methanoplanus sp. FWC-SCC4]WOF16476.1 hypothetical protein F1737_07060 [Methanoplanus sp. FWC-SCC4]
MQKIKLISIFFLSIFIIAALVSADEFQGYDRENIDFVHVSLSNNGNMIIAGDPERGILALITKDGLPVWAYQTGTNISGVAISGNGEYISCISEEGNVILFDNSGNFLWESSIKGCSPKTVISENGSLCLVYNEDLPDDPYTHTLHVFDENGTEFFSKRIPAIDSVGISSDEDYFFAGTSHFTRGSLYSRFGELLWDYQARQASFISANPRTSISDDLNLIGIVDLGGVICLDKSGNEVINKSLTYLVEDRPAYDRPLVYIDVSGDGSRFVTGSEFIGYCLNDTGSILWSFEFANATSDDIGSAAISYDGKLVAASCRDNLFVLDENGKILSKHQIDLPVKRIFISDNGEVIAGGAQGGILYLLSEKTNLISIEIGNLPVKPVPAKIISQNASPTTRKSTPITTFLPIIALVITMAFLKQDW